MKNIKKVYFLVLLPAIFAMAGCSKKEAAAAAAGSCSLVGQWAQCQVKDSGSKSSEWNFESNGDLAYKEYSFTSSDCSGVGTLGIELALTYSTSESTTVTGGLDLNFAPAAEVDLGCGAGGTLYVSMKFDGCDRFLTSQSDPTCTAETRPTDIGDEPVIRQ